MNYLRLGSWKCSFLFVVKLSFAASSTDVPYACPLRMQRYEQFGQSQFLFNKLYIWPTSIIVWVNMKQIFSYILDNIFLLFVHIY